MHFSQPKKDKLLLDLQKSMQIKSLSISRLCETRWSCRFKNCKAVHNSFGVIIQVLQNEINENTNKEVAQAIGIKLLVININKIELFCIIVYLIYIILNENIFHRSSAHDEKNVIYFVFVHF